MTSWVSRAVLAVALACAPLPSAAQAATAAASSALPTLSSPTTARAPIVYNLSFPEREHHWMRVDATFPDLPPGPFQLRISRSSPGRYALHDFARNLAEVRITDDAGAPLAVTPAGANGWDVATHPARIHVSYRVFGDWLDGTYLAVDSTHAHINMPAAVLWARGLERRPISVHFERPASTAWQVATQLLPGPDAFTFTAPNLQYLMDSPAEFSPHTLRTFTVADGSQTRTFRVAMHHEGRDGDVDKVVRDVTAIVQEAWQVYGDFPPFEGNTYTFLDDALPQAHDDAMEHRNSAVLTSAAPASDAGVWRSMAAHEFFHSWNVERIRPRSLEPFDFEDVNVSGELWLAEGVTDYYGPLVLTRAGLSTASEFVSRMESSINAVTQSPGRAFRSVEDMSRLAPLVDGAAVRDRAPDANYLSYYTWGSAIGLALDLSLRDRSDGRVSLDGLMRLLWHRFGTSAERTPGYVERPYTAEDVRTALGDLAGDAGFAADFFRRFIQGHDVADYRRLLESVGYAVRPARPGVGAVGPLRLEALAGGTGVRVAEAVWPGTPAYEAGVERDDVIVALGGRPVARAQDVEQAVGAEKPGSTLAVTFRRRGVEVRASMRVVEDPRLEVVATEAIGGRLTERQRRLRAGWLESARAAH